MRGFPSLMEIKTPLGHDMTVLWTSYENDYVPLHYAVLNIDEYPMEGLEQLVNADINNVVA